MTDSAGEPRGTYAVRPFGAGVADDDLVVTELSRKPLPIIHHERLWHARTNAQTHTSRCTEGSSDGTGTDMKSKSADSIYTNQVQLGRKLENGPRIDHQMGVHHVSETF